MSKNKIFSQKNQNDIQGVNKLDRDVDSESEQVYMSKNKYLQRQKEENEKYNQCWSEGAAFAYKAKVLEEREKVYVEAYTKVKSHNEDLSQKVRNLEGDLHQQKAKIKSASGMDHKSVHKNAEDINREVEELYAKQGAPEIEKLRKSLGL